MKNKQKLIDLAMIVISLILFGIYMASYTVQQH